MLGAALMAREERIPDSEVPGWVVRVRRLMAERGWTGRELARHAGVTSSWVSLTIVQGKRGLQPRRDTLVKLARAFDEPISLWLRLGGLAPEGARGDGVADVAPRPSFQSFVDTDPELTDDQRRILLDLYSSWVPSAKKPQPQHVRRRTPRGRA